MSNYNGRFRKLRPQVLERDSHRCQDCGNSVSKDAERIAHIHHKNGGQNTMANLVTLCASCHNARHSDHGVGVTHESRDPRSKILNELKVDRCTPKALADWTELGNGTVTRHLDVLVAAGHVKKVHRGLYELVDDPRESHA